MLPSREHHDYIQEYRRIGGRYTRVILGDEDMLSSTRMEYDYSQLTKKEKSYEFQDKHFNFMWPEASTIAPNTSSKAATLNTQVHVP